MGNASSASSSSQTRPYGDEQAAGSTPSSQQALRLHAVLASSPERGRKDHQERGRSSRGGGLRGETKASDVTNDYASMEEESHVVRGVVRVCPSCDKRAWQKSEQSNPTDNLVRCHACGKTSCWMCCQEEVDDTHYFLFGPTLHTLNFLGCPYLRNSDAHGPFHALWLCAYRVLLFLTSLPLFAFTTAASCVVLVLYLPWGLVRVMIGGCGRTARRDFCDKAAAAAHLPTMGYTLACTSCCGLDRL